MAGQKKPDVMIGRRTEVGQKQLKERQRGVREVKTQRREEKYQPYVKHVSLHLNFVSIHMESNTLHMDPLVRYRVPSDHRAGIVSCRGLDIAKTSRFRYVKNPI